MSSDKPRKPRRRVMGLVTSNAMDKTIKVEVQCMVRHPRVGKYIRRRTVYLAHDEQNEASRGDHVLIAETKPLSRRKRWRLKKVLRTEASS